MQVICGHCAIHLTTTDLGHEVVTIIHWQHLIFCDKVLGCKRALIRSHTAHFCLLNTFFIAVEH